MSRPHLFVNVVPQHRIRLYRERAGAFVVSAVPDANGSLTAAVRPGTVGLLTVLPVGMVVVVVVLRGGIVHPLVQVHVVVLLRLVFLVLLQPLFVLVLIDGAAPPRLLLLPPLLLPALLLGVGGVLYSIHPSRYVLGHAAAGGVTLPDLSVGVAHVPVVIDDRVEALESGVVPREVLVGALHIVGAVALTVHHALEYAIPHAAPHLRAGVTCRGKAGWVS